MKGKSVGEICNGTDGSRMKQNPSLKQKEKAVIIIISSSQLKWCMCVHNYTGELHDIFSCFNMTHGQHETVVYQNRGSGALTKMAVEYDTCLLVYMETTK